MLFFEIDVTIQQREEIEPDCEETTADGIPGGL